MPDNRITVGNVEITSLSDGHIEFTPENFFPSIPAEAWEPYHDQLNSDGRMLLNVGSFLLRTGGKTVLIDTGLGPNVTGFQDAAWGLLLKDMDAKGVSLDEIDIVAMTHLHVDHVGWNLDASGGASRPTFPNARYLVPKADWDVFTRRATSALAYIQEQVVPLEGLGILELIEGEQTITPELTALSTPGHTAGHTSFIITSRGEQAVIVGDVIHLSLQARETDWCPRADSNPDLSRQTRHGLLDRMENDNALMVSGHFQSPGYGRLVRLEGRRYWQAL